MPGFFIVGAPKCGTTWLYRYIAMHPQMFMSRKELHYFNSDCRNRWVHELHHYESLFDPVPTGARAVGEASVMYLRSRVAVANILDYQPEARFIAMVRNPDTQSYTSAATRDRPIRASCRTTTADQTAFNPSP